MVTEAIATDIEQLARRSHFRDSREVSQFLRQHPELVATLHEALDLLPAYFGAEAPLVLDVVPEHEDVGEPASLFAYVQTQLEPEQAIPLLHQFTEDWWREAARHVVDRFAFSVEYV